MASRLRFLRLLERVKHFYIALTRIGNATRQDTFLPTFNYDYPKIPWTTSLASRYIAISRQPGIIEFFIGLFRLSRPWTNMAARVSMVTPFSFWYNPRETLTLGIEGAVRKEGETIAKGVLEITWPTDATQNAFSSASTIKSPIACIY